MEHQHTTPVFGCEGCITQDRTNYEMQKFNEWKAGYTFRKCPGCGETMVSNIWYTQDGKFMAYVACASLTEDGEFVCDEEHDFEVVIE